MTDDTQRTWDVFIAYAKPDLAVAKTIHDKLIRYARVFLDEEVLRPGDLWDEVTPAAMRHASIILILIGSSFDDTHYLRAEILRALASAKNSRRDPDHEQHVVPVLLTGEPDMMPYGLERNHCLMRDRVGDNGIVHEVLGRLLDKRNRHLSRLLAPAYTSPEVRALADKLHAAVTRLDNLRRSGKASDAIIRTAESEVAVLRKQLRSGGQLHPGDMLSDRYLLLEKIGSGGFAHVWLGMDGDSKVAIKVLRSDLLSEVMAADRFVRGAKAMESLRHPNICEILSTDCLELPSGKPGTELHPELCYYVMEYLAGGDFRNNVLAGRLSSDRILSIILQVGQALEWAHSRGMVHRDVKPENILLGEGEEAKLTDFDLALFSVGTMHSMTGGLGTYIYAAPEQQISSKSADGRSDLYSLGMTTVFGLYGDLLPLNVVRNSASFIDVLKTSKRVRDVLRRAIAWEPSGRYPSIADYCAELRDAWLNDGGYRPPQVASRLLPPVDMELVYVPAGVMLMGEDALPESRPTHTVAFQEFWIGRFPVTNAQYEYFCARTGHAPAAFSGVKGLDLPTQPVLGVNLTDAHDFCAWLVQFIGDPAPSWWGPGASVRLPSEAEWEYAARGPSAKNYPWGFASPNHSLANYGNALGVTTSVGNYPEGASWISAQDMAGNVWEWCEDCWHENYEGAPVDGSAWSTGDPSKRVVRGGSYLFAERGLAGYYRYWWHSDKRQGNQGFRVVVSGIPTVRPEGYKDTD